MNTEDLTKTEIKKSKQKDVGNFLGHKMMAETAADVRRSNQ